MQPTKSYRIWFTQRNGSSLLCKGLEQTGLAGKPGEFFNSFDHQSLCQKYQVTTYEDLRAKLWEAGTSRNKIFGIKHSRHATYYGEIIKEIKILKGHRPDEPVDETTLIEDLFPECKHIFLTRRNKIRQAVSWWKAIKDQVWHIEPGQRRSNDPDFYNTNYDFAALTSLLNEVCLRECSIQEYFSRYEIAPLSIVYEYMILDFEGTVRKVIDFLEIDHSQLDIQPMYYQKTADNHSEEWVQRFREDLQKRNGKEGVVDITVRHSSLVVRNSYFVTRNSSFVIRHFGST